MKIRIKNPIYGVPISFLDNYCPKQFEILGATESEGKGFSNGLWDATSKDAHSLVNNKKTYKRLFIKKQFEILGIACGNSWANYPNFLKSLNFNPNIKYGGGLGAPILNGKATYARILIKKSPQFKIIGIACGNTRANTPKETLNELGYKPLSEDRGGCPMFNGKRKYARLLIKNIS